jgi:hypothetical protein
LVENRPGIQEIQAVQISFLHCIHNRSTRLVEELRGGNYTTWQAKAVAVLIEADLDEYLEIDESQLTADADY